MTTASRNGWWQPTTATPALRTLHTHNDKGVSTAQHPPYSSAPQQRWLTVDSGPLWMTAGRRKWSRLLVTRLQSARHVDRNNSAGHLFSSTFNHKLRPKCAIFVTLHLNQLHAHLRPSDQNEHNSCYQHRGKTQVRRTRTGVEAGTMPCQNVNGNNWTVNWRSGRGWKTRPQQHVGPRRLSNSEF